MTIVHAGFAFMQPQKKIFTVIGRSFLQLFSDTITSRSEQQNQKRRKKKSYVGRKNQYRLILGFGSE